MKAEIRVIDIYEGKKVVKRITIFIKIIRIRKSSGVIVLKLGKSYLHHVLRMRKCNLPIFQQSLHIYSLAFHVGLLIS